MGKASTFCGQCAYFSKNSISRFHFAKIFTHLEKYYCNSHKLLNCMYVCRVYPRAAPEGMKTDLYGSQNSYTQTKVENNETSEAAREYTNYFYLLFLC